MDTAGSSQSEDDLLFLEVNARKQDFFKRKAKKLRLKSKAAYNLLEIDRRFNILNGVKMVVEVFPSPGIWTQILSRRLVMGETIDVNKGFHLFYQDFEAEERKVEEETPVQLNEQVKIMTQRYYKAFSYPGVMQFKGDISELGTAEEILSYCEGGKVDLVLCRRVLDYANTDIRKDSDGAHKPGIVYHVIHILFFACNILEVGGSLVLAVDEELEFLKGQLLSLFKEVDIMKPMPYSDCEDNFAVCRKYSPPESFDPKLLAPYLDFCNRDFCSLTGINRILIPFLVYGDTSAYSLSSQDTELSKDNFLVPLDEAEPACSSSSTSTWKNLYNCMEGVTEVLKSINLETGPDFKEEMEQIRAKYYDGSSSEAKCEDEKHDFVYENGPLCVLIQNTTKLIKYPIESHEPDTDEAEGSDFQFLYEDDTTDAYVIRECLERVNEGRKSSTCTCYEF